MQPNTPSLRLLIADLWDRFFSNPAARCRQAPKRVREPRGGPAGSRARSAWGMGARRLTRALVKGRLTQGYDPRTCRTSGVGVRPGAAGDLLLSARGPDVRRAPRPRSVLQRFG